MSEKAHSLTKTRADQSAAGSVEHRLAEFMRVNNHALPQDGAFYEALGRAIGGWAQVEGALYVMFLTVLKLPHADPAAAAFHAIVSFQGRLKMVDSAALFSLANSPLLARWRALEERVRKKEARRNQAAHFMPRRDFDAAQAPRLYLGPHPYDANRARKAPPPIFTQQLEAMAQEFRSIALDLTMLSMEIGGLERNAVARLVK